MIARANISVTAFQTFVDAVCEPCRYHPFNIHPLRTMAPNANETPIDGSCPGQAVCVSDKPTAAPQNHQCATNGKLSLFLNIGFWSCEITIIFYTFSEGHFQAKNAHESAQICATMVVFLSLFSCNFG